MSRITLRGLAWDHPRCTGPLEGSRGAYAAVDPDVEVVWDRRSLKAFGEAPIDELVDRYDLVVADHPFVGHAAARGLLRDLRGVVPRALLDELMRDSVGPSAASYHYAGGVWGLPTDGAAQIAAYRPDLLAPLAEGPPTTFAGTIALGRRAREAGRTIALAACPTDAVSLLLSLTANLSHPLADDADRFVDADVVDAALGYAAELVALCHPDSLAWNPIQTYEAMAAGDDIVYVPYLFGYSSYSRRDRPKPIKAADVAGPGLEPRAGALLGGAGITVTRSCRHLEAVARYLAWLHRADIQSGIYVDLGGQPGRRSAWTDARVNELCNGFFRDCLATLDGSYLRPRFDGFVPFFEAAGIAINRHLRGELPRRDLVERLHMDYARARAGQPPAALKGCDARGR